MRERAREFIEELIRGELDAALARPRYERSTAIRNCGVSCIDGDAGCRPGCGWNPEWRNLRRREAIGSGGEVNWLIDRVALVARRVSTPNVFDCIFMRFATIRRHTTHRSALRWIDAEANTDRHGQESRPVYHYSIHGTS